MIMLPPSRRNSTSAAHLRDWWTPAGSPVAHIDDQFRHDYLAIVEWAVYSTPKAIRRQYLATDYRRWTPGECVALTGMYDATCHRPSTSPIEYLADLRIWAARNCRKINADYPPWPWPMEDRRRESVVYRDLLRFLTDRETNRVRGVSL